MNDNNIIVSLEDLQKNYRSKHILKGITLHIAEGERIGIVGPNGTGKTTLCEIIANLRTISGGTKVVRNDIRIGMQLQDDRYPRGVRGINLLNFYITAYKINIAPEKLFELIVKTKLEKVINMDVSKYSGGQKQKLNILLALIVNPDLLILDELATGLDLENKDLMYSIIDEYLVDKRRSLILISHNMDEIEKYCDKLFFMVDGQIVGRYTTQEILQDYKSIEEFVRQQFKEYNIGAYDYTKNAIKEGAVINDKWAKSWQKKYDKQKSRESNDKDKE